MRKLMVFNSMSLDRFIADSQGDMSWAHQQDEEWNSFVARNASGEGALLFGRKKRLKQQAGSDLVIVGSASIVAQLSDARLIDEYQIALAPILPGAGKSMFAGIRPKLGLELASKRDFQNGNVFLTYHPARNLE